MLIMALSWIVSIVCMLYLLFIKCHALTACCSTSRADKNKDGHVTRKEAMFAYFEEVASWSALGLTMPLTPSPLLIALALAPHLT